MPETPEKPKERYKRRTRLDHNSKDLAILKLHAEQPELTKHAIGTAIYGEKTKTYIYARLNVNELLLEDYDKITANHLEHFSRVLAPKAMKKHEDMLEDDKFDEMKDGAKIQLLAETYKYTPGLKEMNQSAPPVMINIEQMQVMIRQGLEGKREDEQQDV